MRNLVLLFCGLTLFSCSSKENGGEVLLADREQGDLSDVYGQSEMLYYDFEERATDKSGEKHFMSRMKQQFTKLQDLDQDIWSGIDDLEEIKANLINEWTGKGAITLMTREFGGKGDYIQIYDLSKTDNSTTSDCSLDSENGKLLQSTLSTLRTNITEKLASSSNYDKSKKRFFFKDTGVSNFKDFKDLRKKVEKLVDASNVAPDDEESIIQIYTTLSFSEKEWSQLLPEEATFLNVLRAICRLEKEILRARYDAFAVMNSRYSFCGYGFDKILAIAEGKDVVGAGDTIELQVTMAAFDSYLEPVVKCTNGKVVKSSVKDGMGKIKLIAPEKGEQKVTYKGTITRLTKSGEPKVMKWEKEVWVQE